MAARIVLDSRLRGNDEFHRTPYFYASFPRKREFRKEKSCANRTRMGGPWLPQKKILNFRFEIGSMTWHGLQFSESVI